MKNLFYKEHSPLKSQVVGWSLKGEPECILQFYTPHLFLNTQVFLKPRDTDVPQHFLLSPKRLFFPGPLFLGAV